MKQHLFTLLLFTGVIPLVLSVTRKYYLIKQMKTWSNALDYCRVTHFGLATIENNYNIIQIQNEAQNQGFSSWAWIGLYNDINSWHWSMDNLTLGSMTKWNSATGEPDNYGANQECVLSTTNAWWDEPCFSTHAFVCFDATRTGADRYIFYSNSVTWKTAQTYCRNYHTDLASLRDEAENAIVMGKIYDKAWIGLFRDSWKWSDHTNYSPIQWLPGMPNNYNGIESCVYISNGAMDDGMCQTLGPFFCYSVTRKQQILKVKVQSDQDLNNPAIQAVILEQIMQKLKDHGMTTEIKVKWTPITME